MIEKPDSIRRAAGLDRSESMKKRLPSRNRLLGFGASTARGVSVTLSLPNFERFLIRFGRRFRGRDFARPDPGYRCYKVVLVLQVRLGPGALL
jgi:hypothetical protein